MVSGFCVRQVLLTALCVCLCCNYGVEGTFDRAYLAAMTAMHVYEGRLIVVNAYDGLYLTHLLGQATPTNLAAIIINVERSVADGSTYQRDSTPFT